jgi:nucleoid DNA-binding protein
MLNPRYSGLPGRIRSLAAVPSIHVENLNELMAKMKKVDPDLQKEFRRGLSKAVKPVAKLAQDFVPHQPFPGWREVEPNYPPQWGWANDQVHRGRTIGKDKRSRWKWSQTEVIRGIRVSTAKTKVQRIKGVTFGVTAIAVINKSVPGIIYELAGFGSSRSRGRTRRISRNPNASEEFIGKLQRSPRAQEYKEKRLIYRASQQLGDQVNDNLYGVLKKYLGKEFRG